MRLPGPQRRQQLLDSALSVFADNGFHRTSMNDVADAAGVTKPVVYQHFGSKRDLYRELLASIGSELRHLIERATAAAPSPRDQIEAGFRAYFEFVERRPDAYRVLFGSGTRRDEEFSAETRQVELQIAEMIAEMITIDGVDRSRRLLLATGIVGMAESSSRYWLQRDLDVDPEVLAAQIAQLAWAGLRGIA